MNSSAYLDHNVTRPRAANYQIGVKYNSRHFLSLTESFLWSPYGIGRPLYFHAVVSSSFFPRLISAVADWMSAILSHMVWP